MRGYAMIEDPGWRKGILGFMVFMVLSLLAAGPAKAHKVMIFAWVEGDTVYTESKFSGGKVVKKGEILVYDLEGRRLLEGKTNERGEFSFKVPEKTTLRIVLQAGMGHRAEWTIPAEEIEAPPAEQTGTATSQQTALKEPERPMQPAPGISPNDIQLAVEKALDKKLKPMFKMLAEFRERGPSVTDILGGIGYILGLVGIASYFHYRRKKADSSAS